MQRRKFFVAVAAVCLLSLVGSIHAIADDVEKININTATAEELVQLNGVGFVYADRIITYREEYGPFKTPDEIMQVSGIGHRTFEKNQEIIIVQDPREDDEQFQNLGYEVQPAFDH